MEQRRVTPLTTAGCFAAIMLVFALLSTYVPIFSFIGYFIMPIPMVIIFMKYGLRQTLLLGVTVGFLMGLFIDPVTALVQFLSFGAVGLALGAGFRYEWSAVRLLGTVTAALVAVFVVIALLSYVVLDVNVFTQMNDFFTQFMDSMMAQYQQQGMSDVKLAETRAQLNQVRVAAAHVPLSGDGHHRLREHQDFPGHPAPSRLFAQGVFAYSLLGNTP